MEEGFARVPPNDQDAELAVLSAAMLDKEALSTACESLHGDDFYHPAYKSVFEAIADLFSHSRPVDYVTTRSKLEEMGVFETVGGRDTLMYIVGYMSTSANIAHYCRIVSEKSVLRRLIGASGQISAECFDPAAILGDVLENAEKTIFNISQGRNLQGFTGARELMRDTVIRLGELYNKGGRITGVETGFRDFDAMTSGLQPSELILIAARPSMGKTAIALNMAQHAAVVNRIPTAIFSLEMSKEQLASRMLCSSARINATKMRTGDLNDEEWEKVAEFIGPLAEAPIFVDDTSGISLNELRAKCRRLKLEHGLGLVMIDYIQLIAGSSRTENRQQEMSEISRQLKGLAKELQVPVIALSQLSRKNESRSDHRPMLSDLRDSGAIEQDADLVAFVHREGYYNKEYEFPNEAELIVAKHRNGAVDTIKLSWQDEYTLFTDAAPAAYQGGNAPF